MINTLGYVHQDSTRLKKIAASLPYVDSYSIEDEVKNIRAKERIKSWMDARLLWKDSMNSSIRYIVWMDFASICYQYNHLVTNLHNECSFYASPLIKEIPDVILKFVRVAYPWDTT